MRWQFPSLDRSRPAPGRFRGRIRKAGHFDSDLGATSGFFSKDINRLVYGWTVDSASIDYYLLQELRSLRARSRELCRQNEFAQNFLRAMRRNNCRASRRECAAECDALE